MLAMTHVGYLSKESNTCADNESVCVQQYVREEVDLKQAHHDIH